MPKSWGYCAYCGNYRRLTIDHIMPKSKGGKVIGNRLLVCTWCNKDKCDLSLIDWLNLFSLLRPQHIYAKRFIMYTEVEFEQYYQLQRISRVFR